MAAAIKAPTEELRRRAFPYVSAMMTALTTPAAQQ